MSKFSGNNTFTAGEIRRWTTEYESNSEAGMKMTEGGFHEATHIRRLRACVATDSP